MNSGTVPIIGATNQVLTWIGTCVMSHASKSSDVLGHEMLRAKCAEPTKKQQIGKHEERLFTLLHTGTQKPTGEKHDIPIPVTEVRSRPIPREIPGNICSKKLYPILPRQCALVGSKRATNQLIVQGAKPLVAALNVSSEQLQRTSGRTSSLDEVEQHKQVG